MSDATASAEAPNEAQDALAQQGFKRAKNDRVWDWLNELLRNVRSYSTIAATVLPFLRDDQLAENILKRGEHAQLTELGNRLCNDLHQFGHRLNNIAQMHAGRSGSSKSPDELMTSISISQHYLGYVEDYERVILPTVQELLELFERGGLDTSSIRATPDKQIVYNLFDQKPSA